MHANEFWTLVSSSTTFVCAVGCLPVLPDENIKVASDFVWPSSFLTRLSPPPRAFTECILKIMRSGCWEFDKVSDFGSKYASRGRWRWGLPFPCDDVDKHWRGQQLWWRRDDIEQWLRRWPQLCLIFINPEGLSCKVPFVYVQAYRGNSHLLSTMSLPGANTHATDQDFMSQVSWCPGVIRKQFTTLVSGLGVEFAFA